MSVLVCKCGSRLVVAKSDFAKLSSKPYVCNACKVAKKQGLVSKVTQVAEPDAETFKEPDGVQEVKKYKRKGFGRE